MSFRFARSIFTLTAGASAAFLVVTAFIYASANVLFAADPNRDSESTSSQPSGKSLGFNILEIERPRVMKSAAEFLNDEPITVTASQCLRSSGGLHDFYSEGDYWWPNPKDPDGPYIQKDGETNPENFVDHRHAMIRFSIHVGALTSAYKLTGEKKYADAAIKHMKAWFVDEATRMNPNLQYAQAIKGISKGRGIGVIDTVHLIEVARAAQILEQSGALSGADLAGIKKWFADYLEWMTTSKNGLDELKAANNHGTCFVMQAGAFANFTGDAEKLAMFRKRFKEVLLPKQMGKEGDTFNPAGKKATLPAPVGSFPQELRRTKPYGYSLFNADAMATVCRILSTPDDNLWEFTTKDGQTMRQAAEFLYPYVQDKSKWPYQHDVMFWEFWPVRSPIFLFSGVAYREPKYLELWKSLDADFTNEEVIRNVPIRHPLLWVE